jgi:hypothetical protein
MSAAVVEVVPFVEQLTGYLSALYQGVHGTVAVRIGAGTAASVASVPVPALVAGAPSWLLKEIGYANPDPVTLSVASTVDGRPGPLGAVFTELLIDEHTEPAVRARLAAFPLPASVLLDCGAASLIGLWLLTTPVDLRTERGRVEQIQRALAEHLGGRLDEVVYPRAKRSLSIPPEPTVLVTELAWAPARALPLPGSASRAHGPRVVFDSLDPTRRYPLDEIERAVQLTTIPAGAGDRPRRKKESV